MPRSIDIDKTTRFYVASDQFPPKRNVGFATRDESSPCGALKGFAMRNNLAPMSADEILVTDNLKASEQT